MSKIYLFKYTFSTDDTIHTISKKFDSFESLIDFLYLSKSCSDFKTIENIRFDILNTDIFTPKFVPRLFDSESED